MDPPETGRPLRPVDPGPPAGIGPVARFVMATGGRTALLRAARLPVSSTSMWTRPARPDPGDLPLGLHFDVKEALGLDHAVITRHRTRVRRPSRVGDRIGHHQVLRWIGPARRTPLGSGRSWEIDHVLTDADGELLQVERFTAVGYRPGTARTVRPSTERRAGRHDDADAADAADAADWTEGSIARAAAAARVWAPVHHDAVAARRAGLPGVLACTQHLVAEVEWAVLRQAPAGAGLRSIDLRLRHPVTGSSAGPPPAVTVVPGPGRGESSVTIARDGVTLAAAIAVSGW